VKQIKEEEASGSSKQIWACCWLDQPWSELHQNCLLIGDFIATSIVELHTGFEEDRRRSTRLGREGGELGRSFKSSWCNLSWNGMGRGEVGWQGDELNFGDNGVREKEKERMKKMVNIRNQPVCI
jgi:hypothetical protein